MAMFTAYRNIAKTMEGFLPNRSALHPPMGEKTIRTMANRPTMSPISASLAPKSSA